MTTFIGLLPVLFFAPLLASAQAYSQSAPYAKTVAPTNVTEKSARLNGQANPGGMSDAFQWFEWGISGRAEVYGTQHNSMWAGTIMVDTNADISGLAPNTQYFYRQVVENSHGKDFGITTTFTTKSLGTAISPAILAETNDATFIKEGGAILNGYVSPHGNTSGKTWFEWGKTATLGSKTAENYVGGNSAPVQFTLTGLEPGTPYYFRLAAEGSSGRSYGVTKTFTTLGTPATPRTMTTTTLSGTVATQQIPTTASLLPQTLTTTTPTPKKCVDLTVNLSKNSRAASVSKLQSFLVEEGFLKTRVTGYFGPATVVAVKSYQKSKGIRQTGAVFSQTRGAIRDDSCG